MRFKLLKPLHGWRAFAGEVGVVLLGVLLALGAQQLVERIGWNLSMTEAKKDLAAELELDLLNAQERVHMEALHRTEIGPDRPPHRPSTTQTLEFPPRAGSGSDQSLVVIGLGYSCRRRLGESLVA